MDIKTEINKIFTDEQKAKFKALVAKFNPLTPAAPVIQAAPPVVPVQPAPVALQESPLEDGTVLKYDTPTLSVGSVVSIVGPEGDMPAPAGELKLQDGTVIVVVSQEGKSVVESVTPAQAPSAPVVQNAAPTQPAPSPLPQLALMRTEFEQKFKAVSEEKESLKKELNTLKESFSNQNKDIAEFISLFAPILDIPSADPIVEPKNKFKKSNINKYINRNN